MDPCCSPCTIPKNTTIFIGLELPIQSGRVRQAQNFQKVSAAHFLIVIQATVSKLGPRPTVHPAKYVASLLLAAPRKGFKKLRTPSYMS